VRERDRPQPVLRHSSRRTLRQLKPLYRISDSRALSIAFPRSNTQIRYISQSHSRSCMSVESGPSDTCSCTCFTIPTPHSFVQFIKTRVGRLRFAANRRNSDDREFGLLLVLLPLSCNFPQATLLCAHQGTRFTKSKRSSPADKMGKT
jgi:hypothetical protein